MIIGIPIEIVFRRAKFGHNWWIGVLTTIGFVYD
jgi:hypothetical protein